MNLTHTNSDEPSKENEQRQVRPQKTAHSLSGICSKDASRCVWKPREGRSGRTVTRTVSPVPDPPPERRSSDDLCGDTRCGAAERTERSVKSGTICKSEPRSPTNAVSSRFVLFLLFRLCTFYHVRKHTRDARTMGFPLSAPTRRAERERGVQERREHSRNHTREPSVRCGTAR
jgi:hypothetical protein